MELILDANILFSALIKSGTTRKLMLNTDLVLYTPEFILEETIKHMTTLLKKTGAEKEELVRDMLELLLSSRIIIIPLEEIKRYIHNAEELSPDPDDVLYIALALKQKCAVWSNDKGLKKQDKVKIYSTQDLIKELAI